MILQTNTFQAVMVTDGVNSYAIFIYRCGDLEWSGGATIGYGASSEMFSNHRLSGTFFITVIGCLNNPDNQFFTVLYEITNSTEGKVTGIKEFLLCRLLLTAVVCSFPLLHA